MLPDKVGAGGTGRDLRSTIVVELRLSVEEMRGEGRKERPIRALCLKETLRSFGDPRRIASG
jgi:hypothetical protein